MIWPSAPTSAHLPTPSVFPEDPRGLGPLGAARSTRERPVAEVLATQGLVTYVLAPHGDVLDVDAADRIVLDLRGADHHRGVRRTAGRDGERE